MGWTTDRGFTMHEHLDEMGIIHMNGRVYDPLTGRFMSADPFIQAPGNLQSYNRYAYVMNNPLNLTDPSGYFSLKKFLRAAVAIAVAIYAPQYIATLLQGAAPLGGAFVSGGTMITAGGLQAAGLSTLGSVVAGAAAGFASGAIASGSLQGGVQGALSGGVFGGIGAAGAAGGWSSSAFVAAHAAGGCITSAAGGGSCGSGAVSAAFGKFTTLAIGDIQGDFAKGVASVVAGGVGSVIAGGKFENGAVTAAYGYLFNYCTSGGKCTTAFEQVMHDWWPGYKLGTCISNGDCSAGQYAIAAGATAFDVALGIESKGIAVLGHYPGYTQLAERLGAEVFDVGSKWSAMNTGERWAANRAFLDSGIERGVSFILATDLRAGMSCFRAEVQYLLKNGYEYGTANGIKALVKKP